MAHHYYIIITTGWSSAWTTFVYSPWQIAQRRLHCMCYIHYVLYSRMRRPSCRSFSWWRESASRVDDRDGQCSIHGAWVQAHGMSPGS